MDQVLITGDGEYYYELHEVVLREYDTPLFKGTKERPGQVVYTSKTEDKLLQIFGRKWQLVKGGSSIVKGTVSGDAAGLYFIDDQGNTLLRVNAFGTGKLADFIVHLHKVWQIKPVAGFSPAY